LEGEVVLAAEARMTMQTALLEAGFAGAPLAAVRVDLDLTVLYAAVLFIALAFILQPLLFDPLLKIFELRERRTDGARVEARVMQEQAGKLLRKVDRELDRIRRSAAEERERIRVETARIEAQILEEARESTAQIVAEGRQRIEAETSGLQAELSSLTEQMAREVATAVLGREVR
jgi:F-type H+-transporting ATPase subunit b